MGNGIYLENKLLDSHSQRVILKIVNIKSTESHVYLFRDQNGALGLNIVKDRKSTRLNPVTLESRMPSSA